LFFKNNQKLYIPYRDAIADILLSLDGGGALYYRIHKGFALCSVAFS
jgi:hypothetical protein